MQWRRRRAWWLAGAIVAVFLVAGAAYLHWDSPLSQGWVERAVAQQFGMKAHFGWFHSELFPHARISGTDLDLSRDGDPPLLRVRSFSARADWWRLLFGTRHIGRLRLEGMTVRIPASKNGQVQGKASVRNAKRVLALEEVQADGTRLVLERKDGTARQFELGHLRLAATSTGMSFEAQLRLPRPRGRLAVSGVLGRLQPENPGATSLQGEYTLSRADLGVFSEMAGHITASGKLSGTFRAIEVSGKAEVPDFALRSAGHPLRLSAHFQAAVEGASGAIRLESVTAQLGSSAIEVHGVVKSGDIDLTAQAGGRVGVARIEDFLELAGRAQRPALRGVVVVLTRLRIPSGEGTVRQRLALNGRYQLLSVRFTNPAWEAKLRALSLRSRGEAKAAQAETADPPRPHSAAAIRFQSAGAFHSARGVLRFSGLTFAVPGTLVSLNGTYGLTDQALDFHGHAALAAQPYQLATGWKSLLLRALSPFLQHDANGTVVSVAVAGTRRDPSFKVR